MMVEIFLSFGSLHLDEDIHMKSRMCSIGRRQFLTGTAAASGLLLSGAVAAQTRPCSPVLSGSSGGPGGSEAECRIGAEQDWDARISGPGVVWYHDFRAASEVDAFRWSGGYSGGNDPLGVARPNTVRHITSDGITGGGCLEVFRAAGRNDPSDWWRPFSPLTAPGNGKAADDPGANGTIPVRSWNPTDGGSQTSGWSGGDYGPTSTGSWDGNEFYLQMAMKLDSRRRDAGFSGGKIIYLTRTNRSLTAQELVTYYKNSRNFSIYKAGSPEVPSNLSNVPHIFDEWAHYLYKIIPGDEHRPETSIEVYRVAIGETTYTKIFETFIEAIDYNDAFDKAWNALICSGYHNGGSISTDFYQRYDQIIFSKEFIPVPTA
jgi:hypothetical protein